MQPDCLSDNTSVTPDTKAVQCNILEYSRDTLDFRHHLSASWRELAEDMRIVR